MYNILNTPDLICFHTDSFQSNNKKSIEYLSFIFTLFSAFKYSYLTLIIQNITSVKIKTSKLAKNRPKHILIVSYGISNLIDY